MLKRRSITLKGHASSLALEPEFWAVLDDALNVKGKSLTSLITRVNQQRQFDQPLSSACCVWTLDQMIRIGE